MQILLQVLCNKLFYVENASAINSTSVVLSESKQYYAFLFISLTKVMTENID